MFMYAIPEGEAKFWLEPKVELAKNHGLSERELKELKQFVENKSDEICRHWDRHFRT